MKKDEQVSTAVMHDYDTALHIKAQLMHCIIKNFPGTNVFLTKSVLLYLFMLQCNIAPKRYSIPPETDVNTFLCAAIKYLIAGSLSPCVLRRGKLAGASHHLNHGTAHWEHV